MLYIIPESDALSAFRAACFSGGVFYPGVETSLKAWAVLLDRFAVRSNRLVYKARLKPRACSLDIWKTEIVLRRCKIFITTGIQNPQERHILMANTYRFRSISFSSPDWGSLSLLGQRPGQLPGNDIRSEG